ncbi:hypothetical protein MLD38_014602 [Melastoma candidum]|uniref:Uncharacterized protein n=1 Tax=Melastoma candidum TaxID=119954 RepID=A0ACB9RH13_9MYRT|nr:hypothetical protein MLD38_014602 [Melastoma candidum]
MDSDVVAIGNGVEVAHRNGMRKKMASAKVDGAFQKDVGANVGKTADGSEHGADLKNAKLDAVDVTNLNASTKGIKGVHSNEKSSNPKSLAATGTTAKSQPRQPVKSSAPPSNEKPNQSKPALKSETEVSEVLTDDVKLKPLKKGPIDEPENDDMADFSPMAGDAKPQRVGTLPNYGFSFKCDDRAEKRREFYSKLEEKIHAKEVERNNLQAKSKETQEAEIKQLRKSLNFKATPLPSFYQEPPPPKAELKKIPPTRAKSPKLGRRKNSATTELEESDGISHSNRLSLDENTTRNNPVKSSRSVNPNQPIRRSLPKLPSEKTAMSSGMHKSTTALKPSKPNATEGNHQTPSADEAAAPHQEQES